MSQSPITTNSKAARLKRLQSLSYMLDNAIPIPGTTYRVGIDPIMGLLPGAGDLLGTVFSAYIVLEAALLGLPRASLVRMVVNILLDELVGTVPVVGDWFDFAWKANTKNMQLLEAHLAAPQSSQRADWWFIILLLGGLLLFVLGITAISLFILGKIWQLIGG
jgi:hypothetical protein